jgi:ribosome recycling factor
MSIIEQTKAKMKAVLEHLKHELQSIRTNRANPSMLDGVMVEVYGAMMRVKDVASITTPESRLLLITPFDPSTASAIGKSIEKANLGMMPIVDGHVIRLKIPHMDENIRKDMVKLCHKRSEEAKVSIRNVRRDGNELARKQKSEGNIGEDIMKKMEKEIQDLTDKFCKEADELSDKKEKEITTI